ncbi:efflux RND transporter periplasmic adaptor subunit [Novosphingobium sp. SG707]|uniref:efflux RND transporter periplasmic adaptor subunit n=1 Tax=Novosphingobium sp. SG707 TaxID=2586996 RepID=UPI001445EE6F|nr:efflux RND transporter periplasmic adaptor subunit [Novosphingobium sp. SG707]NKI98894.1 RND family efflux transporter MFP subunit [Novosphingobium sp. SG707]
MTMTSSKALSMAMGAGVLIAGGLWWHGQSAPAATSAPAAASALDAVHPARADIAASFEADASIEPWQSADLFAKVSGYVADMRVDIGDKVTAGQVLATIRLPEVAHELAEDRATLAARRAELSLQQITQKRQEELYRAKGITDQAMDEAKAHTSIAHAQADLAAATLAKAQAVSAYTRIVAPFAGVVTRRMVNNGAFIQAATNGLSSPLFTVQQVDRLRVMVAVPAAQAAAVRKGQSATLSTGSDDPVKASVTRTAGSLDQATRTMMAEIDVPGGRLLAGGFTRARIETARHTGVLGLPNAAIGKDDKGSFAMAVIGGKVARRAITTGITDGKLTEITDGVGAGDVILANAKSAPPVGNAATVKVAP